MTTNNLWKGGDFMEREPNVSAIKEALSKIEGLRESEVPWGDRPFDSKILPRVLDERKDPTHPLRKGRSRIQTASKVAGVQIQQVKP